MNKEQAHSVEAAKLYLELALYNDFDGNKLDEMLEDAIYLIREAQSDQK